MLVAFYEWEVKELMTFRVPFIHGSTKVACDVSNGMNEAVRNNSVSCLRNQRKKGFGESFAWMFSSYGTRTGDAVWKTPSTPCTARSKLPSTIRSALKIFSLSLAPLSSQRKPAFSTFSASTRNRRIESTWISNGRADGVTLFEQQLH